MRSETTSGHAAGLARIIQSPWRVAALVCCYFALHVGVRLVLPESLELDESEQLVLTQAWRWNYGVNHPPLYTWVQKAVFDWLGPGVLGLALVKQTFLFLTFWFVYRAGCLLPGRSSLGVLAMGSILFIPQFMWEAYRDLTHSLAVAAAAAAVLWLVLHVRRQPTIWGYLGLGLAAGAGVLSKINVVILLAALLLSCLVVPSFRPVVRTPKSLLTVAAFLATVAYPCYVALAEGWDERAVSQLGHESWWHGSLSMLWATLVFVLPGLVIYWVVSGRRWPWHRAVSDEGRWLGWVMVIGLFGCWAAALFKGMYFKDRLLLPVLMGFPLWLVERVGRELSPGRMRSIALLSGLVALGVLIGLPASTWIESKLGDPNRRSAPFQALAWQLRERVGDPSVIVAENRWLGGNLRLAFPRSVIEVPEASLGLGRPEGTWVVVWNLEKREQPGAPTAALAERLSGRPWVWEPVQELSAPYLYAENQSMRLGAVAKRVVFLAVVLSFEP